MDSAFSLMRTSPYWKSASFFFPYKILQEDIGSTVALKVVKENARAVPDFQLKNFNNPLIRVINYRQRLYFANGLILQISIHVIACYPRSPS